MLGTLFCRLAALLTILGLLATMAAPVSAGKPEKITVHDEFDEELCGIPVHTTVDGFFMLHIQDYVIQADDPDRAAALLEARWPPKDRSYAAARWLDLVKALPDDVVRARPLLSMGYAWGLLNSGDTWTVA